MYMLALLLVSCGSSASAFSVSAGIRIPALAYIFTVLLIVFQLVWSITLYNDVVSVVFNIYRYLVDFLLI